MPRGHKILQRFVDAVIIQEYHIAFAIRTEIPAGGRIIIMKGLSQAARDIIRVLDGVVIIIAR